MEQRCWPGETNGELIERSLRETAAMQATISSVSGDGGAFALYLTKRLADALNGRWQGNRVDTLRAVVSTWLQAEATDPVSDPVELKTRLLQRFEPEVPYPAAEVMAEARLHCSKRQAQVLLHELSVQKQVWLKINKGRGIRIQGKNVDSILLHKQP